MDRMAPPLEAVSSSRAMQSSRSQISALHSLGSFGSAFAHLERSAMRETRTASWLCSSGPWPALLAMLLSLSSKCFRSKRRLSEGLRLVVLTLSDSSESMGGQV